MRRPLAAASARLDRVLITAPDRLARNYVHQVLLVEELQKQLLEGTATAQLELRNGEPSAIVIRTRPVSLRPANAQLAERLS